MKVGTLLFATENTISGPELVPELESRGLDSLFIAEHSHLPKSTDRELPRMYYEAMDPFVYLATAATVPSNVLLGTGICLIIQRDPIQTAKLVASLDVISNGRFVLGIGAGWNIEEMANHGTTDPGRRFKLMRERVEAMQAIWRDDVPEYAGEFVNFGPMDAWPKPRQKPNPPVLVGGTYPGAFNRAFRYADGWLPRSDVPDLPDHIREFNEKARGEGREDLSVTVLLLDPGQAEVYAEAGADRIIMGIPSRGADKVLPVLDNYAAIAEKVGG